MTNKSAPTATPELLEALGDLEKACSPTELGHAYQLALAWREQFGERASPFAAFRLIAQFVLLISLAGGGLFLANWGAGLLHEPNDFWRGVFCGVWFATIVHLATSWISERRRQAALPPTLLERVDNAIGRWCHAVPAMRDFPK